VYIDLAFYDVLRDQLGANGDFAQAYVIAHEVGHHVQNLLGVSEKVEAARQQLSERDFNRMSVRMELQADFYAGLWAHYAKNLKLNEADIQEGLEAANAIGDDTLQKRSQGRVVPDAFTHGTSQQRMKWFMKGFQTGRIQDGDTFSARNL
ncbi:MAG: neutral zinc metallopeptidase, partial [Fimbriimonadaceae bacterium]